MNYEGLLISLTRLKIEFRLKGGKDTEAGLRILDKAIHSTKGKLVNTAENSEEIRISAIISDEVAKSFRRINEG